MVNERFDRLTRMLSSRLNDSIGRRILLRGTRVLGAAALGLSEFPNWATAKRKKKHRNKHGNKSKDNLCLNNGSHCKREDKKCKAKNCLATPFTIEARWSNPATDHDTFLFVPQDLGSNLPSPFIDFSCQGNLSSAQHYPFAFVSQDATGPGDEVTTIAFLLDGSYEYWIELAALSPTGDLTVTLRNANGRILRSWSSPQNATNDDRGWHVFTIQGRTQSITSVDTLINDELPFGAHDPYTDVCL